jgi:CheY-like chemotaxis protein
MRLAAESNHVVLVVEDDASFRKLMQVMLPAMLGVQTVLARDGQEALAQLQQVKPAVVLIDLSIPGLDGIALIKHLKLDPTTRKVPLLAVTAMARAREQAMEAGCDEFIQKPFELGYLVGKVREYLSAQ